MKRRISGDSENNWDAPSSQTDHFHQHIKVLNTQFFLGVFGSEMCVVKDHTFFSPKFVFFEDFLTKSTFSLLIFGNDICGDLERV